ncbi:nucleoside hydrolase [Chitinophaga arvensicola]|uniref:Inosine-uridine preferring nucleoside hydrolase n=1 Tax=Chitinophaga arvensicola TaxID=29529 RepID=A0A1I0S990_9BACT|nr:nucleoside hydrolase [Chitinophaga arvensicola]SEW52714.1 Inosine-uridine preferring nucleoside hydrolase [Chitinophaga arvensicola]
MKFHKKESLIALLSLAIISFLAACASSGNAKEATDNATAIIFDSDIGPDYDDVGAIALLHALADSGEAKILATIASNKYEGIAAVLNVYNTYFGRPDIPIGVPAGNAVADRDTQHWTDTILANYPHAIQKNSDVPDAVTVYRKVLSKQPDQSVTIVTVGFLTNLDKLLQSPADQISPLSGRELVTRKVKLLVSMAGKFPEGREYNVFKDSTASVAVFNNWPTKVVFSGFEIGWNVRTGLPLSQNESIQHSPVKDVFRISIPQSKDDAQGRMSWDETAVLVAVRGYAPYYTLQPGKIKVAADGSNTWDSTGSGHDYLVEKQSPQEVQSLIEQLMAHQPKQ